MRSFQRVAPKSADSTTTWVTAQRLNEPLAIVPANAVPIKAPPKFNSAASTMAVRSGNTPVHTTVATAWPRLGIR